MRLRHHHLMRLMIAALFAASATIQACGGSRSRGRIYDPYWGDYHRWNGSELGLYRRWEGETQRSHIDFGRRPAEEQHAYFTWRHQH